VNEDIE